MPTILSDSSVDVLNHKHAIEHHGDNVVHCVDLKIGFNCNESLLAMLLERGAKENAPDLSTFHLKEDAGFPKARQGWGPLRFKAGWKNADIVITMSGVEVGRATGATVSKFTAKPADAGLFEAECNVRIKHWTDDLFSGTARCVGTDGVKMTITSLEQATLDLTATVGDDDEMGDGDAGGDGDAQGDLPLNTAGDGERKDDPAAIEQRLREDAAQFQNRKRRRKSEDAAQVPH